MVNEKESMATAFLGCEKSNGPDSMALDGVHMEDRALDMASFPPICLRGQIPSVNRDLSELPGRTKLCSAHVASVIVPQSITLGNIKLNRSSSFIITPGHLFRIICKDVYL